MNEPHEPGPERWLKTHAAPPDLLERAMRRAEAPVRVSRSPLRPLMAAAAWLLVGASGGWAARTWVTPAPSAPSVLVAASTETTPVPIRLVLHAPDAAAVSVAGTFNGWDPRATPLVRGEGGVFHVVLPIPRGRYEYMFVIDGDTWVPDPIAPLSRPDDFGQRNGILDV